MRFQVRVFLFWFLLHNIVSVASAVTESPDDILSGARQQYEEAMKAVDKGRWTEYELLRPGLEDYPLAIYLDYQQLTRQPQQVRPVDALRFISRTVGSPLPNRFSNLYLKQAGRERRWQDFLQVKPDEPESI